jgi:hypothetical protein
VDLRPATANAAADAAAFAVQRQELTSWTDVHQVLVDHQPVRRLWRTACSVCDVPYPCRIREAALDELTGAAR